MACSSKNQKASLEKHRCRDNGIKRIFCKSLRDLCAVKKDIKPHTFKNLPKGEVSTSNNDVSVERVKVEANALDDSGNDVLPNVSNLKKHELVDVNSNILETRKRRESDGKKDIESVQHVQVDENSNTLEIGSVGRNENSIHSKQNVSSLKRGHTDGRFRGSKGRGVRGSARYGSLRCESYGNVSKVNNQCTGKSCDAPKANKGAGIGDGQSNITNKAQKPSDKYGEEHFQNSEEYQETEEDIVVDSTGDHNQQTYEGNIVRPSSNNDSLVQRGEGDVKEKCPIESVAKYDVDKEDIELHRILKVSTRMSHCNRGGFGKPKRHISATSVKDISITNRTDCSVAESKAVSGDGNTATDTKTYKLTVECESNDALVNKSLVDSDDFEVSFEDKVSFETAAHKKNSFDRVEEKISDCVMKDNENGIMKPNRVVHEKVHQEKRRYVGYTVPPRFLKKQTSSVNFSGKGTFQKMNEDWSEDLIDIKESDDNFENKSAQTLKETDILKLNENSEHSASCVKFSSHKRGLNHPTGRGLGFGHPPHKCKSEVCDKMEETVCNVGETISDLKEKPMLFESVEDWESEIMTVSMGESSIEKEFVNANLNEYAILNTKKSTIVKESQLVENVNLKESVIHNVERDVKNSQVVEDVHWKESTILNVERHVKESQVVKDVKWKESAILNVERDVKDSQVVEDLHWKESTILNVERDVKDSQVVKDVNWKESVILNVERDVKESQVVKDVNWKESAILNVERDVKESQVVKDVNWKESAILNMERDVKESQVVKDVNWKESAILNMERDVKESQVVKDVNWKESAILNVERDVKESQVVKDVNWKESAILNVERHVKESQVVKDVNWKESVIVDEQQSADMKESECVEDLLWKCGNEEPVTQLYLKSSEIDIANEFEVSTENSRSNAWNDEIELQENMSKLDLDASESKFLWEKKLEILTSVCVFDETGTPADDIDVEVKNDVSEEVVVEEVKNDVLEEVVIEEANEDMMDIGGEQILNEGIVYVHGCFEGMTNEDVLKDASAEEGNKSNISDGNQHSDGFSVKDLLLDDDIYQLDNSDGFCNGPDGSTSVSEQKDLIRSNIEEERSVDNERDYVSKSAYDELIEERIECLELETKPKSLNSLEKKDSVEESPLKRYLKCVNKYQEKNGKGSHSKLLAKYGRSAKDVYRKFELNEVEQCDDLERELLPLLHLLERDLQSAEENEVVEFTETGKTNLHEENVCIGQKLDENMNEKDSVLPSTENSVNQSIECARKSIHPVQNLEEHEHISEESDVFSADEGHTDEQLDDRSEGTLGEVSNISEDEPNICSEDAEVGKMKILSAVREFQRQAQKEEESSESEQLERKNNRRLRRHSSSRRISTCQEPEEAVSKSVQFVDPPSTRLIESSSYIETNNNEIPICHNKHKTSHHHHHLVKEVNNNSIEFSTCTCSRDTVLYWMWRSCLCSEPSLLDVWSGHRYEDSYGVAEPEKLPWESLRGLSASHESHFPSTHSANRASHLRDTAKHRKGSEVFQSREDITIRGDNHQRHSVMDPKLKSKQESVQNSLGRGRGSILTQFHCPPPPPPGFETATKRGISVPRPKLPDHRLLQLGSLHASDKQVLPQRKENHGYTSSQKVQTHKCDINKNIQVVHSANQSSSTVDFQFPPFVRSLSSQNVRPDRGIPRTTHPGRVHRASVSLSRFISPYTRHPGQTDVDYVDLRHDSELFDRRRPTVSHEFMKNNIEVARKRSLFTVSDPLENSFQAMDIKKKIAHDRPKSHVEKMNSEGKTLRTSKLQSLHSENMDKEDYRNKKNVQNVVKCISGHSLHSGKTNKITETVDLSFSFHQGMDENRNVREKSRFLSENDPNNNVVLDFKEGHSVNSSAYIDTSSSNLCGAVRPNKNMNTEDGSLNVPVYVPPHRRGLITSSLHNQMPKSSIDSERPRSTSFIQSLAPGSYFRAKYEKQKKEVDQREAESDESCENVSVASQDEAQNEQVEDVEDKVYTKASYANYPNYVPPYWDSYLQYEYPQYMVPYPYHMYPPWPYPGPYWEMYECSPPSTIPEVTKTTEEENFPKFEAKLEEEEAEVTSETPADENLSDFSPMGRQLPKFRSKSKFIETDSDSLCSYGLDWKTHFLERCLSYNESYIDSHCHIDLLFSRLGYRGTWSDFRLQNQDTFPVNFGGCVAVFCNPGSFKKEGLWTSVAEEENVWLTFGCHPKNATEFTTRAEEGLRRCLSNEKVVALGEIGLDYSGMFYQYASVQKQVLRKQLQIALEMSLPLVIHCREAEDDCLEILEEMVPKNYKIHCHCFTGTFKSAARWLNLFPNMYLGLTPVVTYRTATGPHEVARFVALERLLLETDSPYFLPRKIPRGELAYSHPGLAVVVAEEVARIKNIAVKDVLKACRQNTLDMYGI